MLVKKIAFRKACSGLDPASTPFYGLYWYFPLNRVWFLASLSDPEPGYIILRESVFLSVASLPFVLNRDLKWKVLSSKTGLVF